MALATALALLLLGYRATAAEKVAVEEALVEKAKRKLVFASASQHPPYNFFDASGKPAGIHWDVLEEIGKKLGINVEMKMVTRKRIEKLMLAGEVDAFPNALEWTENLSKFVYTDPVSSVTDRVYVRREAASRYSKFNDFKGKTLVGIRGYNYNALEPFFKANTIERKDVKDEMSALRMLQKGRAPGVIVVDSVADWLIMQNDWGGEFVPVADPVTDTSYRFIMNKSWEPWLPKIDAEIKAMREQGTLRAIADRYRL